MAVLVAVLATSTSLVLAVRLAVLKWVAEEACKNAYHRGKREGWYSAMRLIPGHDSSHNRSKADSIWN